ncbi:hypothetical protein ABW19_dt0204999 [Dactylella cylindrospora]|nr:hypothetical protein ABW19_dt0204999 [Dactylella cylindrospora]
MSLSSRTANEPIVAPHNSSNIAPGHDHERRIIIVGAGIIGLSTAYYLSAHHPQLSAYITVLDSSPTLFACASGRAGGFLAKDWFKPAVASLGELSFRLHRELADQYDGRSRWGYCGSTSFSLVGGGNRSEEKVRGDDWLREGTSRVNAAGEVVESGGDSEFVPKWLKVDGGEVELSSTGETTAQVDPHDLCQFLLGEIRKRGVVVRHPVKPLSIVRSVENKLEGLVIRETTNQRVEETLPCSDILISAGPWSSRVFRQLFGSSTYRLPITSLSGHSVILRSALHPPRQLPDLNSNKDCHAVFASIEGLSWHPEVFSRLNGEIYLAGLNSLDIPLPETATDVNEQEDEIRALITVAETMINAGAVPGELDRSQDKLTVVKTGLCHRPVTPGGLPIIARVPDKLLGNLEAGDSNKGGVYISTGHGPWGISMSLGTGKVMAEMIMGEKTSVDVSQLGLQ